MAPLVHSTNCDHFAACPSVYLSGEVSGHFPENTWRECPEILHADVSWPLPELIRFWSWSVKFPPFWCHFVMDQIRGFQVFSYRTHGENDLTFCMLMYLNPLQSWLVSGQSLLILVILALFWLRETAQIWGFWAFPGEGMEGIAWKFAYRYILATFRTG